MKVVLSDIGKYFSSDALRYDLSPESRFEIISDFIQSSQLTRDLADFAQAVVDLVRKNWVSFAKSRVVFDLENMIIPIYLGGFDLEKIWSDLERYFSQDAPREHLELRFGMVKNWLDIQPVEPSGASTSTQSAPGA